jgi:DNA transformation protein and related proteins
MAYDEGLVEWAREALEPIGSVTMRRMMGAATLYCDGIVFAVVEDEIWFKSDAESDAAWDAAGCERFTFTESNGQIATMNYRRAPADVYDDPDAMREWAGLAIGAGQRAAAKRKPRKKG